MATLTNSTAVDGAFTPTENTLSASDVLTFDPKKKQILLLRNGTGGSLTATIDGASGTTVNVPGIGAVSVASGLAIAVPAGETRAVILSSIRHYLSGVVTITGAATMKATIIDL